jgi:trehalose 2-sulfotransferase
MCVLINAQSRQNRHSRQAMSRNCGHGRLSTLFAKGRSCIRPKNAQIFNLIAWSSGGCRFKRLLDIPMIKIPEYPTFYDLDHYRGHIESISEVVKIGGLILPEALELTYIFMCFTNRSGSNFLSDLLSSGGMLNIAKEILDSSHVVDACKDNSDIRTLADYFSRVALNDQVNGLFALKLAVPHLIALLDSDILRQLISRSHFVLLERSDKLNQALSFSLAMQTGVWARYQGDELSSSVEANFDREQIDRCLNDILVQNYIFDDFFAKNGLSLLKISYEMAVFDPALTVRMIRKHIGKEELNCDIRNVRIQRQDDARITSWRARYLDRQERALHADDRPPTSCRG